MSTREDYECIVVGLGLMGSSALHRISTRTGSVLGLEQYEVGHGRGSSHGHTRIVRKIYGDDHKAEMAAAAFKLWEDLEHESGTSVIRYTGEIDFGPRGSADLQSFKRCVRDIGLRHDVLSPTEAMSRWQGLHMPRDYEIIFTPDAGIVHAQKSLNVMRTCAQLRGARIRDNSAVESITDEKGNVVVRCKNGACYGARKVVLAPGAWAAPLLQKHFGVSVDVRVIQTGYWYFSDGGSGFYDAERFPVFIKHCLNDDHFYGTPAHEYPGMLKIGAHYNPRSTTAETRSFSPIKQMESVTCDEVALHFPSCEKTPALAETCLYSVTRKENFLLDRLSSHPDIVVLGGGSGHAFKHGPAIGEAAACLAGFAQPDELDFDLSHYELRHHLTDARL